MKELLSKIVNAFKESSNRAIAISIVVSIGLTVLSYYSISPMDVTTWDGLWALIKGVALNPALIGLIIFNLYSTLKDSKKK